MPGGVFFALIKELCTQEEQKDIFQKDKQMKDKRKRMAKQRKKEKERMQEQKQTVSFNKILQHVNMCIISYPSPSLPPYRIEHLRLGPLSQNGTALSPLALVSVRASERDWAHQ